MALRAVILDYGRVLSGPPEEEAWLEMLRLTGLSDAELQRLYWEFRRAYDEGKLTGAGFWREVARAGDLLVGEEEIGKLNDLDARMWTQVNEAMLTWFRQVRERGFQTAIVSNIGDNLVERMEEQFAWLQEFDVLVWSYLLGVAKPDAAIYEHALDRLGLQAEEALFLDDKPENVEAARRLGMHAIEFSTVERLREDLAAGGWDLVLPSPK